MGYLQSFITTFLESLRGRKFENELCEPWNEHECLNEGDVFADGSDDDMLLTPFHRVKSFPKRKFSRNLKSVKYKRKIYIERESGEPIIHIDNPVIVGGVALNRVDQVVRIPLYGRLECVHGSAGETRSYRAPQERVAHFVTLS